MTETVYYDSTNMAVLQCPECGKQKKENVTGHLLSSVSPTITCTCECGHIYRANLEWKDSEAVVAKEKDAPEVASETVEANDIHNAESVAIPSEDREAGKPGSDDIGLDGPLSLEGTGPETMICPNCQKEQSVSEKCLHCGIIFAKYRSDTPVTEKVKVGGGARQSVKPKTSRPIVKKKKKRNKTLVLASAAGLFIGLIGVAVFAYMHFFQSMTTDEIVAKTEGSIALIKHSEGNGSGFLIADNILVTNFHVVSEVLPDHIEIYFPAVSEQVRYVKRVVYFDEYRDIAMLEIQGDEKPLPLSVTSGLKRGEDLIIIGSPGVSNTVLPNSVTRGSLNSERDIDGKRFLQISAAVNPGNSGGPAINFRGQVVAIVTLKASAQEGITFGVPMDEVKPVRDRVLKISESEKNKVDGLFLADTLYKKLFKQASANLQALTLYAQGMELAEKNHLPHSDGLAIVKRKIDTGLAQITSQSALEKADDSLAVIRSHSGVDRHIKEQLASLRQLTEEILKQAQAPRIDPAFCFEQVKRFRSRLYTIAEALELKLVLDV